MSGSGQEAVVMNNNGWDSTYQAATASPAARQMDTLVVLFITFLLTVIAPLLAAWITLVCNSFCLILARERATNAAPTNAAATSAADVALTVATTTNAHIASTIADVAPTNVVVSNAQENLDTSNHVDDLYNLNGVVVTLNGQRSGQVVVNIEDHDDEESGV